MMNARVESFEVSDAELTTPSFADGPFTPIVLHPEMERLYQRAEHVAAVRLPVLIIGETGVGKEHFAELIHIRSKRANQPFVRINCAAITPTLFESELFGHERGAFTGADRAKKGWLESAGSGTVFLDEIGEMPLAMQAKLLRALESGAAPRVGGTELRPITARFVSATNRDIETEVENGNFRRDLYHRIACVRLAIPPLRERTVEILPLAESFARAAAADPGVPVPAFSPAAREALLKYEWPGNIRELRNVIESAVLFAKNAVIDAEDLQLTMPRYTPSRLPTNPTPTLGRRPATEVILSVLASCGGNQTLAAERLGVGRRTLCRWLVRLNIPRPRKGVATPPRPTES
jgi:two-component system response regulator AtoC